MRDEDGESNARAAVREADAPVYVARRVAETPQDYPLVDSGAAALRQGRPVRYRSAPSRTANDAVRVLRRVGVLRRLRNGRRAYVVPLMGLREADALPMALTHEIVPVCFDCWPGQYLQWDAFFRRYGVRRAAFTAKAAADHFSVRIASRWLPEATDPSRYDTGRDLANRTMHVAEIGRRYARFHDAVTADLRARGRTHLYEPEPGTLVYSSRDDLARGMAETVVCVCFPSATTHPQRSGSTETLTHRYLEAIASRCIVLGHAPDELVTLFGYDPVVEVEWSDPAAQLASILDDPAAHQRSVDRNLERLHEVATWDVRIGQLFDWLTSTRGAV